MSGRDSLDPLTVMLPRPDVPLSPRQKWTIVSAAWGVGMIAAAFAFVGPVLALILEERTGSGEFIGLFATVGALTTVTLTPLGPWLMKTFPARALVIVSLLGTAVCFPLYYLAEDPNLWFAIRFVQGIFMTVTFVTSETWINDVAPEKMRGRILGFYAIFLAGGLGIGAAAAAWLIAAVGLTGWEAFAIGAGIALAGLLPYASSKQMPLQPPEGDHAKPLALLSIMRDSPGLMATVFAFGAVEFCLFHFLPVYGVRLGYSEAAAAALLLALPVGNILLVYPIGMLADRFSRHRVLGALFAVCTLAPLLAASVTGYATLMVVLSAFIGAAAGLYTVGLAILTERHKAGRIAAANAAFIMCYGLGSLVSPYGVGAAMDRAGPDGMLFVMAGLVGLGWLAFAVFERHRAVDLDRRDAI